MSEPIKRRKSKAAVATIGRGPDRSSLFYWMVEQHHELAATAATKRICWSHVCEVVRGLGLTDVEGNAPSTATARKTWYRARLAVKRLGSNPVIPLHESPGPLPPMRVAASQSPGPIPPQRQADPVAQYVPAPANTRGETEEEADARVEATMARMRRHFDEASGRIPPQRGTKS